MMPPHVSIVMATYNRPRALRLAIESVRAQSWEDWELLVVGDACSDSTEDVVSSFADPRIRYLNLPRNFGEQSGPNNVGIARARGRFVAFLNHDDLWMQDHLRGCLDWIEATGAAMVFPLTAVILPATPDDLRRHAWRTHIHGIGRNGRFDPIGTFAPASSWLFRREAIERIGRWKPARECVTESSRDFLFRAWRAGLDLRELPRISVLAFHSGLRNAAYSTDDAFELEWFWGELQRDPAMRQELLARARNDGNNPCSALRRFVLMTLARLGVAPASVEYRARGVRKGMLIDMLRIRRGLTPLDARETGVDDLRDIELKAAAAHDPGPPISFRADGRGTTVQKRGWSYPEPWGTWAEGDEAGLAIHLAEPCNEDLMFEADALAFVVDEWPRQNVSVRVGATEVCVWAFDLEQNLGTRSVLIERALVEGNLVEITFRMPDSCSPRSVGHGSDPRRLGLGLVSVRLRAAGDS